MTRPTFTDTIAALTLGDPELGIEPFDDCVDVAEALRHLESTHRGGPTKDAGEDYWGRCSECGQRWPCPSWNEGEQDAVLFLGRAQDRVAGHARDTLERIRSDEREKRAARRAQKAATEQTRDNR